MTRQQRRVVVFFLRSWSACSPDAEGGCCSATETSHGQGGTITARSVPMSDYFGTVGQTMSLLTRLCFPRQILIDPWSI